MKTDIVIPLLLTLNLVAICVFGWRISGLLERLCGALGV